MRMFAAAGLALALMIAPTAEARPFTAKDLATQDRVSDPNISSDGRWVAYSVRSTDWDGNKGVNALWLIEADGATPPRKLAISEGGATGGIGAAMAQVCVHACEQGIREFFVCLENRGQPTHTYAVPANS